MFNLSLSFQMNRHQQNAGPPSGFVTMTAFTRDKTLFDSSFAFGGASATLAISGTGSPDEPVEARAVSLDDGGATTTAWADVGTISSGGTWSGQITAPRSASWFRPEVRLKNQPGVVAQGANRFGVGHVIAIWGQSEPERIINSFYNGTTAPAVSDPEAVQIIIGAASTPQRILISNSQPYTAAVAAMAATLIAARPGEKFAVIFQTVAGTDPRALVDDSDPSRLWSADKALHDFATADGQKVGIAAMSWYASPGNLAASYGQALYPLFSGKDTAGAAVTFPATINYGSGQSYHADHWFGELYDYTKTKWVIYGPHRFDIDADMQDATHYAGGAPNTNLVNKQLVRDSVRAMLALPSATMFLPLGIEPTTYVNGYDDGAGGWTDLAHPAGGTTDGVQALARLTAHAVLRAAGLSTWAVPVFDNCLWEPTGAYVEAWSSAGAITTTRLARAEAALPASFPHWTTVMGFQVNGAPAQNAQIVAGRVRIFKNGGGNFTAADTIQFGEGGASGQIQFPEDHVNGIWKNLPIVDVGVAGVSGIPVRPLPATSVFANTLPVGTPTFTTSATGPYYVSPTNIPAGTAAITFSGRFRLPSLPSTTQIIFAQDNLGFDIEIMNNGNLRANARDGLSVKVINNVVVPAGIQANVWYDLICATDQVAQNMRISLNGVVISTLGFSASGNGLFLSNRAAGFLARKSATLQFIGDIEYLKMWYSVTGSATEPATTPIKHITGPAAVANGDSWKLGSNAT
ncbi:LamG-like jellyroll fold domain-containing protein [Frigidibacter sp. SD6-1]|uniref:LamG-like jellyroll fold domain-containing protein n=1 Tax=Frigidibacter sp. SD6-1 TaxID=3032581 RepID=UPI0024E03FF0|nr:LamG-like jellyroll fold domain-containing protein [Frigidibacter sp. SD6-1]